jgi:hypothetical protein
MEIVIWYILKLLLQILRPFCKRHLKCGHTSKFTTIPSKYSGKGYTFLKLYNLRAESVIAFIKDGKYPHYVRTWHAEPLLRPSLDMHHHPYSWM